MLPHLAPPMRAVALVLTVLVAVGGLAACSSSTGNQSTPVRGGTPTKVSDLKVGTCYLRPESTDVDQVAKVPCRRKHDAEVFAVYNLDGSRGVDFPGQSSVQSAAQEGCQGARFKAYVGEAYEDSGYFSSAIAPTQKTWVNRYDRQVVCSVITADGSKLKGTVKHGAAA